MRIRTADLSDLKEIARVEAACFPAAEAATEEEFEKRLTFYKDHFWLMFDGKKLIAFVDGKVAGTAGIDAIGAQYKVAHRAEFGIGILKEYWGLGIGRALMEACIHCAKTAGYAQLELEVVAEYARAISMYQTAGFVEYGRNPKGFRSRNAGYQELISMRLEL